MKTHKDGDTLVCEHSARNHPEFVSASCLITVVIITPKGEHDYLNVFNRGGLAGLLIVKRGDGEQLAGRMIG